jgi:hypothetical protein
MGRQLYGFLQARLGIGPLPSFHAEQSFSEQAMTAAPLCRVWLAVRSTGMYQCQRQTTGDKQKEQPTVG